MAGSSKRYLIGTSGWNYPHWKKRFYPEDLPQSRWFDYYSEHFSTVEINYSFYRWPSEKTIDKWKENAPADFKFTLKAPRTITHVKRLKDVKRMVEDFYRLTSRLGENRGCHLFQLPPSFRPDDRNIERVRELLSFLDARNDNAIEFRHKDWWKEQIFDLLNDNGAAFCTVFGLDMPGIIVPSKKVAYFRFHGMGYSTKYSKDEIKKAGESAVKTRAKKVYCYFNNDANAYAVENAKELKGFLEP